MSKYKKKLDEILSLAIEKKASDIYIMAEKPLTLRVNSILIPMSAINLKRSDTSGLIDNLLTFYQIENLSKNKSINISYNFKNNHRFRINVFFQNKNLSIILRHISNAPKSFKELGLPEELEQITKLKQGLVLITGPTGSGKSTTLISIINNINNERHKHIITIEDPIEFMFKDNKSIITQREVFEDTHSFKDALKDSFRQDPDIVMVGELRDYETIAIATTAAETGHLVLATLHTNSASQTIDRIIDSFPGSQQDQIKAQLALCLSCVFSQRLIRAINGNLLIAYELMYSNPAISNLIRENKIYQISSVISTSKEKDMISLNRCLVQMIQKKEISIEEAFSHTLDSTELKMLLD